MRKSFITLFLSLTLYVPSVYGEETLSICSFNIQFLGQSVKRDDAALARILEPFDVVVVQELVAPPFAGTFPDGTPFKPDGESAEFFEAMRACGFDYKLSEEDTGKGETNHKNSTATEWYAVFYKESKLDIADDLPNGFLANDRTAHPHYDRVPYAFGFREKNSRLDFVLISVHLRPGASADERRKEELATIAKWVLANDDHEKDFIILGDMNIEDAEELDDVAPRGFRSLNNECRATNTNVFGPKPYDHVMLKSATTKKEVDRRFDFQVYNLIEAMRPFWDNAGTYPGGALNPIGLPRYAHDRFRGFYSDHHPVVFRMLVPESDDDD